MKQIGGNHYLKDIQPWDVLKAWWPEHFAPCCLMNAIKYIMRDKHNKVEDLKKAIHYLEEAIHFIQLNEQKPDYEQAYEEQYFAERN